MHDHKYFLIIIDDFSRYTWTILLKSKAEVQSKVEHFINFAETQFEIKVKSIRSNNGPGFFLKSFLASKDILHQTSCVETPQQNGRVEHKHQHILNVARALMFQSHLPTHFWSYIIKHVVYLINRVPSPIIGNKTLFELLFKQNPISRCSKFLDACAMHLCMCLIATSLIHEPDVVFFLGINLELKDMLFFISTQRSFLFPGMFNLMR